MKKQVYLSSLQTPVVNTPTTVALNSVVTDTQSAFNTSTYKYTPQVGGLYLFVGSVQAASAAGGPIYAAIAKNGTIVGYNFQDPALASSSPVAQVSFLLQMNGTTDYVTLIGYSSYAAAPAFSSGSTVTYLTAAKLA